MLGAPHLNFMCNNQQRLPTSPLEAPSPPTTTTTTAAAAAATTAAAACAPRPPGLLGGDGVAEIRDVTRWLEEHGIECCVVGVRALIFYGAGRVQDDWDICVPDHRISMAVSLLTSNPMTDRIASVAPFSIPQPSSLHHTYTRFEGTKAYFSFVLVPASHVHLSSGPFDLVRSSAGLPYPSLPVLMQSFLEMNDDVSLCDCIDGSNVSESWGKEHLDLDGINDLEWANQMNRLVDDASKGKQWFLTFYYPTQTIQKRETWVTAVRNKKARLGWTSPDNLFETRFRLKGQPDPWLR